MNQKAPMLGKGLQVTVIWAALVEKKKFEA